MRFIVCTMLAANLLLVLFVGSASAQTEELSSTLFLPAVMRDFTPSWHWEPVYTVTVSARTTHPPLAAIDRRGRPHLFWYYSIDDNQIHHVYLDGATWHQLSPSQGLTGNSLLANAPIVTDDDRIHLIWYNELDKAGDRPYRYVHALFTGDAWGSANEVFRSKYSTIRAWPRLDAGGRLRVGITSGFLAWRAYLQLEGVGGWQELANFTLPSNADIIWPDAHTGAHVYGDDSTGMRYWRWADGTFITAQSLGIGKFYGRTMTVDDADHVHLHWSASESVAGNPVTLVHHQCIDDQLRTSAVTFPGDTQAAREVVGATDGSRLFVLAWQEPARRRIMLWDGCSPVVVTTIPSDPAQSELLRAVAVSAAPRKVCVFLQKGISADYVVRCAGID